MPGSMPGSMASNALSSTSRSMASGAPDGNGVALRPSTQGPLGSAAPRLCESAPGGEYPRPYPHEYPREYSREYPFPEDPVSPLGCALCAPRVKDRGQRFPSLQASGAPTVPGVPGVPTVAGAPAHAGAVSGTLDDFEDRDPNRLNQPLQVLWEDVVGEPDGVRSPDATWRCARRLFRCSRDLVYALPAAVLGPPLALLLGAVFGLLAFLCVWTGSPLLRVSRVLLGAVRAAMRALSQATIAPVFEALSACGNARMRGAKVANALPV